MKNNVALPNTQLSTEAVRSEAEDGVGLVPPPSGWVTKRDRHMQLINTSIYDKEIHARNKAIEDTRRQQALRRDRREKLKIQQHLNKITPQASRGSATATNHEITLNGLQFYVIDGGSKLARVRGEKYAQSSFQCQAHKLQIRRTLLPQLPNRPLSGASPFYGVGTGTFIVPELSRPRGRYKSTATNANEE